MTIYRYDVISKLFYRKCQELHGLVADGQHAVGLGGVEIDAVALLQNNGLATDIQLHTALEHEVEFLSGMGVLVDPISTNTKG